MSEKDTIMKDCFMVRERIQDKQGDMECFYLFKTLCDSQDFIRRTIDGMKDTVAKSGGDARLDRHAWCETVFGVVYDYVIVGMHNYSDEYCAKIKEEFGFNHEISSGTLDWRYVK